MSSVGLDIGGTFLKAAWLDEGPLTVTRRPIPGFLDTSGKAREIDPNELMVAVIGLLDEVVGERECSRIFVTGQMAGLAFVDARGRAIAPLISWQDTRVDSVDRVRSQLSALDLVKLGDGLRIGSPLVTLSEMAASPDALVTSLIGFVANALTGKFSDLIHATDAASLGLLDVVECHWSRAALDVAGLSSARLPRPIPNVAQLGPASRYGAQVMTPVGDHQAALLGVGLREGIVSMNIATGCQVSILSLMPSSRGQLRPYFGPFYLHTVTHLPAGRLLATTLETDIGRIPNELDWQRALGDEFGGYLGTDSAVKEIANACARAVRQLGDPAEVLFSGGVSRRSPKLRRLVGELLPLPQVVDEEEDASIAGLRILVRDFLTQPAARWRSD